MQTIFLPDLNEFCRKYLIAGSNVSLRDTMMFPHRQREMEALIFEQLLLFDKVAFKVYGENIPLAALIKFLGEKGFEEVLEQGAIQFVLWTPTVVHMVSEVPGIHPISSGTLNSPAHCDPEVSIELGLNSLIKPLTKKSKRNLVNKLVPHYLVPNNSLADYAVGVTKAAFNANKLISIGLSPLMRPLENLPLNGKIALSAYATELLEYTFLIGQQMTSYSKLTYFDLFSDSTRNIRNTNATSLKFNELAKLEGLPDLKMLYPQIEGGLSQLPKLRGKGSSRRFREWLASTGGGQPGPDIVREYVEAIAKPRGILDTARGKITKSVVMTAIGAGMGAAIDHSPLAAMAGAGAANVVEKAADFGLDLLDSFLLDGLLKGWTPRMFFDDLKKLPPGKIARNSQ